MIRCLCGLALASALVISALPASADADLTLNFERITSNSPVDVAPQLSVEVIDLGGGEVQFTFINAGPTTSAIADVYFELTDPALLDFSSPDLPDDWDTPANPGHLPGLTPGSFVVAFSSDADSPVAPNGINAGESAAFEFDLASGVSFGTLASALQSTELRIGIHVQRLPDEYGRDEESDAFVTTVVPTPPGLLLGAVGLVGVGFLRHRQSR